MKLTIIKDDNRVYIDGVSKIIDLSNLNPTYHAVQWYDTYGEIEIKNNQNKIIENRQIDNIDEFQIYIDLWYQTET